MARKKKKRGLRNFGSLNISLNIPFNLAGQGNRIGAELFDKNPELKEYLTKESFEKLYDSEFSEFVPPTSQPETKDPFQEALDFLNGQASTDQIKAFLQTTLGKTSFGEITNFENPDNSVGDSYVYSFGDGTPLFNPEFISSIQSQLDSLGIDLDDLQALLDQANEENGALSTQNGELSEENATLTTALGNAQGTIASLQAQLAKEPQFANSGLPTINLTGNPDPDTGVETQVFLNANMANVTSRTLTIYKITPGTNSQFALNDDAIVTASEGFVKDFPLGIGDEELRIGNNGNPRILTITFEPESVYVFEVTGKNDGGVEDNENPKTLTRSAIFTTVDTDDAVINNLSSQVTSLNQTIGGLEDDIESLEIQIDGPGNSLNTQINNLQNQLSLAQNSSNNARSALDGFSDDILQKIEGLKNSLSQEAVTDGTISSMNTLISSFNNYVTQINDNTPVNSPVTQISSFEATNIEGQGGESSGFFPTNYPEWLGGDNISVQDNDNILFDLNLNLQQSPIFTIPDFVYVDDRYNMPIGLDTVFHENKLENKFLTILRFTALRATNSVVKNNSGKSGFIIGRGNNFTSNHSQTPHTYLNGNINNVIDDWSMSGEIDGTLRTPQLTVETSNDTFNLGNSGINTTLTDKINESSRKGIGNKNIVSLASPSFYGSDEAQSLIYLNAGDTFRFNINPESLPYIDDNNINQSYVLGLTFHFVVKNYDSYEIRTRRCTGVFNFNGGALMGV